MNSGNFSGALSAISPETRAAYSPEHAVDLGFCDLLLRAAGFPPAVGNRITISLELDSSDAPASAILARLKTQWLRCGINVEAQLYPRATFRVRLAAPSHGPFLTSIDTNANDTYGLLNRLYSITSPENFTGALPASEPGSVQAWLDAARVESDPAKRAGLYRNVSAEAMDGNGLRNLRVLPLVWQYDLSRDQNPPELQVLATTTGSSVSVNGITLPGAPGHSVTGIHWDWGDGATQTAWFPATHAYPDSSPRRVIVTSHQSDGRWSARSFRVLPGGGQLSQTGFTLPDDAEPNNNGTIGPFCCTGRTLTVRYDSGSPAGYLYFFGWQGQAYNVTDPGGSAHAVFPNIELLVSDGVLESSIFFSAGEMIPLSVRTGAVGRLAFTATVLEVKRESLEPGGQLYIRGDSVRLAISVSLAPN